MKTSTVTKLSKFMGGPVAGIVLGAILGIYIRPNAKFVSGLRALAAGIVLAAVSTELIPKVADTETKYDRIAVVIGILAGLSLMITIRTIFDKRQQITKSVTSGKMPWELIISIAIDFFIDALLIGMALSTSNSNVGMVLAIALGFEISLLTLTTSSQMIYSGISKTKIMGVVAILAAAFVAGGLTGYFAASKLKGTSAYYGMMAFGVAALIWLIVEDLLVGINKVLDSRISASLIFAGFMAIIVSGWFGHSH